MAEAATVGHGMGLGIKRMVQRKIAGNGVVAVMRGALAPAPAP